MNFLCHDDVSKDLESSTGKKCIVRLGTFGNTLGNMFFPEAKSSSLQQGKYTGNPKCQGQKPFPYIDQSDNRSVEF